MPRRRWIPNKQYWGEDYGRPIEPSKCINCGNGTSTFLMHPKRNRLECLSCAKETNDADPG